MHQCILPGEDLLLEREDGRLSEPGEGEGLPDRSKGQDGIGAHKYIVGPSAGCGGFPVMLNSWEIDVEKVNSGVHSELGFVREGALKRQRCIEIEDISKQKVKGESSGTQVGEEEGGQ